MEMMMVFWEKLVGLVTSQRFITSLVGLVTLGLVMFNLIMPLFKADFDPVDVPNQEQIVAQWGAWIAQAVAAGSFILGVIKVLADMVKSFESRPPTLKRDWQMPVWMKADVKASGKGGDFYRPRDGVH